MRGHAATVESSSLTASPLVISGSPTESEQLQAQTTATLSSPEAVSAREESQTKYEGLDGEQAEKVDNQAFPELVDEPDGGLPLLPEGEQIVGFPSDFAAALALPEGKHGVVESAAPIAVETPSGRVPVDVRPRQVSSGFEATAPASGMHVRVGRRLSEGASLSDLGVTLTPVTEAGTPLGASGVIDGASVFYGDSEDAQAGVLDTDSLIKLKPDGFSEETMLRSERAPSRLFFKVGMPEGASLSQEGSGPVVVVDAGKPIATILVPSARDAEGAVVPVSMGAQGAILTVTVEHPTGQYRMPIAVDPTVSEGGTMGRYQMGRNWEFGAESPKGVFTNYEPKYGVYGMEDHDPYGGRYVVGEFGLFGYETGGHSRIYEFVSRSYNHNPSTIASTVYIRSRAGLEAPEQTAGSNTVCVAERCAAVMGSSSNWENGAFYKQSTVAEESASFEDLLEEATVYIVQEEGPSVRNTGSCGSVWTPAAGCKLELNANDPGIGISEWSFSSQGSPEWGGKHKVVFCNGVQCPACIGTECSPRQEVPSMSLTGLAEGEDTVKATVQDPVGLSASSERIVRIDNAAPYSIVLSGLGPGGQVGPGEYGLRAEATDGSGTTKSSGVKSISLYIDGSEVGSPSGSCSPGQCTAHSGTWTIFGHEYATGRHTATVVATDNAGNTASESFTMIVRPASPIALGPGSVNPQSGELSLGATDVSIGGGLTVSRSYRSQHLTQGLGGPLGSQWALAMGGQESLFKQADGSMVLTDASGAQTIFAPDGKGGFISPTGDANLTLSTTPCEAGKTEDMLKNAAASTTTCFAVPPGGSGEVWAPNIVQGSAASDKVTYRYETAEVPKGSGKKLIRPKEALAPVPAGVTCSLEVKPTELRHGCRVLTFNYAETTTAKGEAPAEWGDVEGQMTRAYYTAYDPVTKGMHEVEVAHYLYDKQGRLRALWDPRVTPEPLKTYYGYDAEGHVTAITPPGQETLAFVYGTIPGSPTPAVLKATQAPASAPLWKGESPVSTEAPKVTGTHTVGVRMAVSEGKWSGSPVVYGYQWEDCNTSCTPIPGATNANYTPTT